MDIKAIKKLVLLVSLLFIAGCELEPTDKQVYFQDASHQSVAFEQTSISPDMYTVCGNSNKPCLKTTTVRFEKEGKSGKS